MRGDDNVTKVRRIVVPFQIDLFYLAQMCI